MSEANYLELLPAVDVKDGKAVRLVQGELNKETNYGKPLDAALDFQKSGAEWIHLVDLAPAHHFQYPRGFLRKIICSKINFQKQILVANRSRCRRVSGCWWLPRCRS